MPNTDNLTEAVPEWWQFFPPPVAPPYEGPHWYDWDILQDKILTWAPILFMGLLVYFLWRIDDITETF